MSFSLTLFVLFSLDFFRKIGKFYDFFVSLSTYYLLMFLDSEADDSKDEDYSDKPKQKKSKSSKNQIVDVEEEEDKDDDDGVEEVDPQAHYPVGISLFFLLSNSLLALRNCFGESQADREAKKIGRIEYDRALNAGEIPVISQTSSSTSSSSTSSSSSSSSSSLPPVDEEEENEIEIAEPLEEQHEFVPETIPKDLKQEKVPQGPAVRITPTTSVRSIVRPQAVPPPTTTKTAPPPLVRPTLGEKSPKNVIVAPQRTSKTKFNKHTHQRNPPPVTDEELAIDIQLLTPYQEDPNSRNLRDKIEIGRGKLASLGADVPAPPAPRGEAPGERVPPTPPNGHARTKLSKKKKDSIKKSKFTSFAKFILFT